MDEPYYRRDLARIHHLGFGFHAEDTAPGILALLERVHGGLVVEVGCGSGLLTRHLVGAGHRVIATDASPAMLDIARVEQPNVDFRLLILPDDPVPEADAIVSVGHGLNYLDTVEQVEASLVALAKALRPGGMLAIDLCDVVWAAFRAEQGSVGWVGEDWALVTRFSVPAPDRYVREMTTFALAADGMYRRDEERHDNVMVDVATVPGILAAHGVEATVRDAFGAERLPVGLKAIVGRKRG